MEKESSVKRSCDKHSATSLFLSTMMNSSNYGNSEWICITIHSTLGPWAALLGGFTMPNSHQPYPSALMMTVQATLIMNSLCVERLRTLTLVITLAAVLTLWRAMTMKWNSIITSRCTVEMSCSWNRLILWSVSAWTRLKSNSGA